MKESESLMEKQIKFSVLVPVYKVEKYIDECIGSVLNQTYPNFELILVDDGSPDRCGEICDEYAARDERVRVFHKPNGGLMHTRRFAIEKAQGDYYVFLDSDDYIALNTLEVLERSIRESGADCVIYGIEWLKPDGTEHVQCSPEYCNRLITDKAEAFNIILNDEAYNALCRKCVKASCFDGRDFSPYYHISSGEDRLQSTEILENAKSFLFIPDNLHFYRVNSTSITHTVRYDSFKADFTIMEVVDKMLERTAVFSESDYNRLRNHQLDALVIDLKRLSRFCSDKAHAVKGMKSIRDHAFYIDFLSRGYGACPALPGVEQSSGLRRALNRMVIALFNARCYGLVLFFNKHIYR